MTHELEDVLSQAQSGKVAPLYLLWGEEFLVRKGADELTKRLLPDASVGLNLSVMDGASPSEIAAELATLPLFPGRKLALVRDPEFLAPKKGRGDALGRARDAWRAGRRKEAARRVLAIAARAGWSVKALDVGSPDAPTADQWKDELNIELGELDRTFLQEVAAFCREEGIRAPETDEGALLALLERGMPEGHALVIAATDVEAKHPLVKWAREHGVLVERKVASKLKELDLSDLAAEVLQPFGKRLAPAAEMQLKERVGGNMRLLQSELEKLALFTDGAVIQPADVEAIVHRAREEEFLELSDALQKRDLPTALKYVDDAIQQGAHPLVLLGAVASVVRTLLMNRERLSALSGGKAPRSFDDFKARIFPAIEREAKAAKARVPHPYAAFMGMQASTRYTRDELLRALAACAESDVALKLGGGRLVVERLLWTVCGKAAPWESGMLVVRRELER